MAIYGGTYDMAIYGGTCGLDIDMGFQMLSDVWINQVVSHIDSNKY